MIDPLTATTAVTGAIAGMTGAGVAWRLYRRARKTEALAATLYRQLLAERHDARHDQLTGLLNRRAFFQLGNALLADPHHQPLVAVVADLDDFKLVNDVLGHLAGDQVLATVADRLAALTGGGLAARLGGDELAALLPDEHRTPGEVATALAEALGEPIRAAGQQLRVRVSVGAVAVPAVPAPPTGTTGTTEVSLAGLLRHADAAMYRTKQSNRAHARTVTSRQDWSAAAMPTPNIDPHQRDPGAVAPADSYRRADPVWVYRAEGWRAGVVETASPRAVTVTYRPPDTRGTGVDTLTAPYLLPRDEVDPLLDHQPN